jgi:hypothetical protein
LLDKLDAAYDKLMSAYQSGDFAKIGKAQAKLNSVVAQLNALDVTPSGGAAPSGSASSTPSSTPSG